jgi:beta-glucosidase
MKKVLILVTTLFLLTAAGFGQAPEPGYLWLDNSLTIEERAEALVAAMTMEEKIQQLMDEAPAIDRLGVPRYGWWNEALHGVARNGRATVFPQAIALGATFDEQLVFDVASAISDEARAKFNIAVAQGNRSRYAGLTFWSPNVNLFRDPRWGRGQETYGEDPYLTSRIGVAFVKGLQGDHPTYLKAAACAKHYVVHSGPEALRHEFNAVVNDKDLWETYMPAFKALVTEAKVEGVMGAYNRTNGESCCASPFLMTEVLREQWGFDGYFVSDCGAVNDIWRNHKLCDTPQEAAAMAVKAGMNVNCGRTFEHLGKAVEEGLLTEEDIDRALVQLTKTKIRLGFFDPDDEIPFRYLGPETVGSDKNRKLAREAAVKSMVLLKNKNNVLPLKRDLKTLFVTGPHATNMSVLLANYYGISDHMVTFVEGIAGAVSPGTSVNYRQGQLPYQENINRSGGPIALAASADACIAVVGIDNNWEGEEGASLHSWNKGDNTDCRIPAPQIEFLKKIRSKGDNPLIVVVTGGSPVIMPEVFEFADAVIYSWYPGEQGGNALADIIFGEVSPSGRLPFTVPRSIDDVPPYEDYSMKGRTYRYMEKEPLFPFGFGLSYSTIEYSEAEVSQVDDRLVLRVKIVNTGDRETDEVVQLYVSSPDAGNGQPITSLRGIERVGVPPLKNDAVIVDFVLTKQDLLHCDDDGQQFLPKGDYTFYIGAAAPLERSRELGAPEPVKLVVPWKQIKKL